MAIPVWKPVKGYEGLYVVSNTGQVRSLIRCEKRTEAKRDKARILQC